MTDEPVQQDPRDALVEAVGGELLPAVSEYAELGLDAVTDENVLQAVPAVGTLVALAKAGITIRDRLFANKLLQFLSGLSSVSQHDRSTLIERLNTDPEYGRNVGEHLLELLEKIDAHRKPSIVAEIFKAYVAERIDGRMLNRLNHAVDRLPFYEIDSVRRVHELAQEDQLNEAGEATLQALEQAGLLYGVSAYGGMNYRTNDLCDEFVNLELDNV